ncbi:uncharacterized protein LOC103495347 [Cucumis melo]|uniref:Uncharacterized protein LOC103495347 n=1 Tax=Cucumis melo TaxID=3656 RepID=A0A1S4E157_CUCME|nr:uncharacterized protein LOC103495347 [Cucumis melo]
MITKVSFFPLSLYIHISALALSLSYSCSRSRTASSLSPVRDLLSGIEMEEVKFDHESKEKIFEIFKEFMASVAKLDELGTQGSQLLSGLKQGLVICTLAELLRRPSINGTSKLIENVIETSNTENLRAYIEAGCINTHDGAQSTKKLHTCRVGLDDHLKKARSLIDELERLHNDVNIELETENPLCTSTMSDEDLELDEEEATVPSKKLDANDYALLMGIVKVMIKKNHIMQEKIISGLSLKSSSGELETYCLMWSLQPYIDDGIMSWAWKLV